MSSASGRASGGRTKSATPVRMALLGMPSKAEDSSLWTMTSPPDWWMSTIPREPSLPVPESTMATARLPMSCARERKNTSMGRLMPLERSLSVSSSLPPETIISLRGGMR